MFSGREAWKEEKQEMANRELLFDENPEEMP